MCITTEFKFAVLGRKDTWVPANGGTETPFNTRTGRKLLYCYNPKLGKHAYLDVATDIILTDEEAASALDIY
jgi:hypothetical protein